MTLEILEDIPLEQLLVETIKVDTATTLLYMLA
jgi:hypothetical protein